MASVSDVNPNKVFINMMALRHNVREIKKLAGTRGLMAVVSSDAYGHGLLPCASTLAAAGVDYLSVNGMDEALALRANGIDKPIMLTGRIIEPRQAVEALKNKLWLCVSGAEELNLLAESAKQLACQASISLHIDNGTGISGFSLDQAWEILSDISSQDVFQVQGIDFYMPFEAGASLEGRIKAYDDLCAKINQSGLTLGNHSLNSRALTWHPFAKAAILKVGAPLYGLPLEYYQLSQLIPDLRPVMTVLTRVCSIYEFKQGEPLCGDINYRAPRNMRIAVTPFGMSNGLLNERVEPRGWVLINEKKAPLLGRINMFQSLYDISDIENVEVGDVAVVLGRHCVMEIDAAQIAKWCLSSPREISSLFGRLNKVYYEGSDF